MFWCDLVTLGNLSVILEDPAETSPATKNSRDVELRTKREGDVPIFSDVIHPCRTSDIRAAASSASEQLEEGSLHVGNVELREQRIEGNSLRPEFSGG